MMRAPASAWLSRSALARFGAARSGASATEFAILSVPFLLLIFGTMEFGRLMWSREALEQTAIAGARCMGMTQTGCGTGGVYSASMTQSYVIAQGASWSLPLTSDDIVLNNTAVCGGVAGFSSVKLGYTFNSVVPRLLTSLAGGAKLSVTACFPNHK